MAIEGLIRLDRMRIAYLRACWWLGLIELGFVVVVRELGLGFWENWGSE